VSSNPLYSVAADNSVAIRVAPVNFEMSRYSFSKHTSVGKKPCQQPFSVSLTRQRLGGAGAVLSIFCSRHREDTNRRKMVFVV